MTNKQCCKRVYGPHRSFSGGPCLKTPTIEVNGRWYCAIHSPEGEAKRRARQDQRDAERDKKWREELLERQYAADAVRRCKELGIVDPITEIMKAPL